MVLSNDADITMVDDGHAHMLHVPHADESNTKAVHHMIHHQSVPVPMAMVRSHLRIYEDDCIDRLLTRIAGSDLVDGYTKGPHANGIQVVHGRVNNTTWRTLLTTGKLNVSAENAARVLVDPARVPMFDDNTQTIDVLEKLSDATDVRLVSCKPVLITSPRDFCVTTTVRRECSSGRIVIATRSVDHLAASHRDGFVRALSFISGYVLTPDAKDPNVCELALVAHMDLGGNMPAFVVRYLGLSAPIKLVEKIREVVVGAADH